MFYVTFSTPNPNFNLFVTTPPFSPLLCYLGRIQAEREVEEDLPIHFAAE